MEDDILQVIEEEIVNNPSLEEMKALLTERGFSQGSVDEALERFSGRFPTAERKGMRRNIRLFTTKEVFDRIGYGFATHQFINILFYQTAVAAGLGSLAFFIVGVFNGLKNLFSVVISSFLQEYSKVQQISKRFIGYSGILFGFSFLLMAFARAASSVPLFAAALLVGSVGVVSYGDLYNKLLRENLRKERMGAFLGRISQFGVLITAVSLLISGYVMDAIPATGTVFTVGGLSFRAYGYLISFEITALAFIVSGYVLHYIRQKKAVTSYKVGEFLREYRSEVRRHVSLFFKNRIVFLLLVASVLAGVAQALGNSFYGIFIYEQFKDVALGGFLNVAAIYTVAVVVSVFGPWLTARVNRVIGLSPMLVFGTMLVAMMPFFAAWQPNFFAIGAANALSIIGSAIVGVAQGLLARKLLPERERKMYFHSLGAVIAVPFIVLLPLGAWYGQVAGLQALFQLLVVVLVGVVVPLYVILVAMADRKKLGFA